MLNYYVLMSFIIAVSTFLILPGPVNLVVVNASVRYGLRGAFWSIVGTNLASLVLILIAGFMISGVLGTGGDWLTWLTVVGGFYLIYYAYGLYRTAKKLIFVQNDTGNTRSKKDNVIFVSVRDLVVKGFLVGISNPKDVLFFLSFLPPFIERLGLKFMPSILLLTMVWCILDYTLLLGYAFGAKKLITSKIEKVVLFTCAGLFLVLGLYVVVKNIPLLFVIGQ